MNRRHALCIVIDGLRASALGTYGNTTYPTPQLDALAARSQVVEWLWADSPRLEDFYRGVWQGTHGLRPRDNAGDRSLLDRCKRSDLLQWLVTDDPWLCEQSTRLPFDEALLLETAANRSAKEIGETAIGKFFTNAVERLADWKTQLDEADASSLTWIHSRGLHGPWDAPLELRMALLDEEDDPSVPRFVDPPRDLHDIDDPDVLLAHRIAYAAQVSVVDACVGAFCQAISDCFAGDSILVMLAGSRGFALGEHGTIGADRCELFGEQLHLPWLIQTSNAATPPQRHAGLAQPADIGATLSDWFSIEDEKPMADGRSVLAKLGGNRTAVRQIAVAQGDAGELAIRTPSWLLRRSTSGDQLFTKPDDRWEFNDIASRCPEIVEGMADELAHFQTCCQTGEPLPQSPRDSTLAIMRH